MSYDVNRSYLTLPGELQNPTVPNPEPNDPEKEPDLDKQADESNATSLMSSDVPDKLIEETEKGHS
jgi:hypothetical protein